MKLSYSLLVSCAFFADAFNIPKRSLGTAYVDVSKSNGAATTLASNFIYGFPDSGVDASSAIPDHFLTDIKFQAARAGGAQVAAAGWAYGGRSAYQGRFNSTLSNYRSARKYGASFYLLPHDLWGSQGGSTTSTPFPGDNGNWTEMEAFLDQLVLDMTANNMTNGVIIDLWNEPDLEGFWARPWDQYLEYISRAHRIFKAKLPYSSISGPSSAHSPSADSENWKKWCSYVVANNVIPDIYAWHQIGTWEREPDTTGPAFETLRQKFSLPRRPIAITEYAWPDEQTPAGSVFYISQLERNNMAGLRANWGSGSKLHDYLASLLGKSGTTYFPNGEWQLYKYYAGMRGVRLSTQSSHDKRFDVFATKDSKIKILAGTRVTPDAYDVVVSGLSSAGFGDSGTVRVRTYRFNWSGASSEVGSAQDLGVVDYPYSSGSFTIHYNPTATGVAYAYEIGL